MSVYVEPMTSCLPNKHWPWKESCHLMADSEEELIAFAVKIGLKPKYIQRTRWTHFDLESNMRERAVKAGAIEITHRQLAKLLTKGNI